VAFGGLLVFAFVAVCIVPCAVQGATYTIINTVLDGGGIVVMENGKILAQVPSKGYYRGNNGFNGEVKVSVHWPDWRTILTKNYTFQPSGHYFLVFLGGSPDYTEPFQLAIEPHVVPPPIPGQALAGFFHACVSNANFSLSVEGQQGKYEFANVGYGQQGMSPQPWAELKPGRYPDMLFVAHRHNRFGTDMPLYKESNYFQDKTATLIVSVGMLGDHSPDNECQAVYIPV